MLYETVMTSDSGQAATFFLFRSFLPAPLGFFSPPQRWATQERESSGAPVWRCSRRSSVALDLPCLCPLTGSSAGLASSTNYTKHAAPFFLAPEAFSIHCYSFARSSALLEWV